MSIKQMAKVWDDSPYTGMKLLVHLVLADFANDAGVAFPSQSTIARKARTSENWVRQVMKEMVAAGHLRQVAVAEGRGKTARWLLVWEGKPLTEKPLTEEPPTGRNPQQTPNSTRRNPQLGRIHSSNDEPLCNQELGTPSSSLAPEELPGIEQRSERAAPRKRFPVDMVMGPAEIRAADAAGLSADRRDAEWELFRNHHLAQGKTMANWTAAWGTWCRRVDRYGQRRGGGESFDLMQSVYQELKAEGR